MTIPSPNQGITLQQPADPSNLPGAQVAWDAVMENRLVQRYLNEVDRTARNPVPNAGEVSYLIAEGRQETFNGVNWISSYSRNLFQNVRRATDAAAINNSTVLVNDATLATVLPAVTGIYRWRDTVVYSSSQAGDYKIAYTWPGTAWWGTSAGLAVAATGTTGDTQVAVTIVSGTSSPLGGAAVGTRLLVVVEGEVTLAGVGGTLQLQYAQQTADATNTIPAYAGSSREVWRVS